MRLVSKAKRPSWHPMLMITRRIGNTPESWRVYLFYHSG
jgi:hypothetical protein